VTEEHQQTTDDRLGDQIEGLARELARTISAAPAAERERLREMAVHLLRDEVEIVPVATALAVPTGGLNPFAISIPLLLVAAVTWILSPLITLLLVGAALLMMVWGVAAVVLGGRDRQG
jgi:hypothetical protein